MHGNIVPRYTRENVELLQLCCVFKPYRKLTAAYAMPITGPFECVTQEGVVRCQDGYLVLDIAGFPYPVSTQTFEATYEAIGPTAPPQQLLTPEEMSMLLREQQEIGEPRL